MQTNWVCPSGAQRCCKNESDSSLESLTVTRVESFCEKRDSSCIESPFFSTWLESSPSHQQSWLESRYHWKMVPDVALTSLIAVYLYLSFLRLHFTCLFHTQSFQRFYPDLSASVAASQLALCWMCDSPRTGCAWWTTPVWREQAEIKLARRGICIVAWCHSSKVCALAALPFQSQQSGALARMWR